MEEELDYKNYYRDYLLNAVYSHEENKIYSALRAVSNLSLTEMIPLVELVISNDSLSFKLREYAEEVKKEIQSTSSIV